MKEAAAANRTRETQPSGMRRGLNGNGNYGELGTRRTYRKGAGRKPSTYCCVRRSSTRRPYICAKHPDWVQVNSRQDSGVRKADLSLVTSSRITLYGLPARGPNGIIGGMNRTVQMSEAEAVAAVAALVEEYRDVCFWFMRQDYRPVTATEAVRALDTLERYGDRQALLARRRTEVMAITTFQRDVLRLLAKARMTRGESYVAGGVALNN